MTTIPARLAKMSTTSGTFEEARKRSLSLYRDWYRAVSSFFFLHKHAWQRLNKPLLSPTGTSNLRPLRTQRLPLHDPNEETSRL